MTDKKNNNNNAQEKGFNSGAAYGDPKDNTREKQKKPAERNKQDIPFSMDSDGNVSTGDADTENVRTTDSVMDDLSSIDVSEQGLPANDQAESDVPPADPAINDVPDADRSMSDSTEHLAQNAADRTRRKDSNGQK
ncbi:hypothetical protein [Metaplanococcus flavidus]|uniref:Uncharacterized protein n=1 Tax=Metaplanococcus flavidus TaxID=569883 RepID=A0ABW3L8D8_9BACL